MERRPTRQPYCRIASSHTVFRMTVTENTLAYLFTYGVALLALIIFFVWKALRSWNAYLPFVDLVSYIIGGLTLALALWNGTIVFSQNYPKQLASSGLTNVLQPYGPFHSQIRSRRDTVCEISPDSIDCSVLQRFLRSAYAEVNGEFFLVRVPDELLDRTPAETVRLISSYNKAFDAVPRPIDAMAEAIQNLGGYSIIALLFAWMLGVHRRWIAFNLARRQVS